MAGYGICPACLFCCSAALIVLRPSLPPDQLRWSVSAFSYLLRSFPAGDGLVKSSRTAGPPCCLLTSSRFRRATPSPLFLLRLPSVCSTPRSFLHCYFAP